MHSINTWVGTVAVAGLAAAGCKKGQQQAGPPQMPPPVVVVADAKARDVPVYIDGIGKITAPESVTITPRIAGQIIDVRIKDGEVLKKDQLLFQIDPAPSQAALAAAQASVAQAKAAADFARIELERYAAVAGTRAISKSDYDTRKNQVDVAEAQQKAAEAQVRTAQINLDYCTIRSPIDGRAGEVLIDVGNVVKENDTSLLSVQSVDPIYADFVVNEQQLIDVRQNMADGTLKTLAMLPTDKEGREGNLVFLDNAVQDATGTIRLRATMPNKDQHFWPGQFVQVRLVLKTIKDAVLVPSAAMERSQQGPYVYVVKGNDEAEIRPVKPGQAQGDQVVIAEGVTAGERVVTDGQKMVIPGKPVKIAPSAPAGNPTTNTGKDAAAVGAPGGAS